MKFQALLVIDVVVYEQTSIGGLAAEVRILITHDTCPAQAAHSN